MAVLHVLKYPDAKLRVVAKPVTNIDDNLGSLIDDMFETLYEDKGVGLAATQVGESKRIVVIDVGENKKEPMVLINPEVIQQEGKARSQEACLSVPGIYGEVERAKKIKVKALDRDGQPFEFDAEGLLATCVQHEIDHLDGKLFIDHLSSLKRKLAIKRLQKYRRQTL